MDGIPLLLMSWNGQCFLLHCTCDLIVIVFAADEALGIKDHVFRVGVECVLHSFADTEKKYKQVMKQQQMCAVYSCSSLVKLTQDGVIQ